MDRIIKNILKKIENEGYEAYIVGGFVRDKLLNNPSYDVDICTNALPKDLKEIFPINKGSNNYGGFNLKIKKYNIDITTYRKEKKYDNRHPIEVEYVNNLFEDINRRDFTINSLCIDKNDNIIDLLESYKDLKAKVIRVIGDPKIKFTEDPLRMLRAIRFSCLLNFDIEENAFKEICNSYELVGSLSSERVKEELSKILSSKNFQKGLDLLKITKIDSVIGLTYEKIVYTSDILGMWAQIDIKSVQFNKTEKENITKIKQILRIKNIDNITLFNYGLYISSVAGIIMGESNQSINKKYKNLPIKSMKDIDISGDEIIKLLNIKPCKLISEIFFDIKNAILLKKLKNKKSEIKKYIVRKWQNE